MKKIIISIAVFIFSAINVFAIETDMVDKDNIQNLINSVSSLRAGTDRVTFTYDFAPMLNGSPLKLAVSILDLKNIVNNTNTSSDGKRYVSFSTRSFVGLSYGQFGFGYQYNVVNNSGEEVDYVDINKISQSHSITFGMRTSKFYFVTPLSFSIGDKSVYTGNIEFSLTPRFVFLFRAGVLSDFTIGLHYGMQFSDVTNSSLGKQTPASLGIDLSGTVMFTRFDSMPMQISMPIDIIFRYGVKSAYADIEAGYAYDLKTNYMYDANGALASDSIKVSFIVPLKIEAKLGAIYLYGMPRLLFDMNLYKTDFTFNLHYGIEGEFRITPIENFSLALTGYAEGTSITKSEAKSKINLGFGAGLDVWCVWRF